MGAGQHRLYFGAPQVAHCYGNRIASRLVDFERPLPGATNDTGSDSRLPRAQAHSRHVRGGRCGHREAGTRRRRCPWQTTTTRLVGCKCPRTREPTDYVATEKHPDLYRTSHIIKTGDELRRLCTKLRHSDATSRVRPRLVTHVDWNEDPKKPHEAEPILAVGVDGCSAGWFFVEIEPPGTFRCGVVQSLRQLVPGAAERVRIFVDIPIGLPDGRRERECDQEARRVLGEPRRRSVFRTPARAVLDADNYEDANRLSLMKTGTGLTKQAFGILGKCREVDQLLRDDRTVPPVIREIHPELCFWAFAGRKPMKHCKKDGAGFRERLDVLKRIRPSAAQEIERTLSEFKPNGKHVARDDAVDAMVAALTAAAKARRCEPCQRSRQEMRSGSRFRLPMEMVYVAPDET